MPPREGGRSLTFYTGNAGKAAEVRAALQRAGWRMAWKRARFVEPQGDSLEEVARAKIAQVPRTAGRAMVEDTGIFLDALGGFPGVYSAYVLRTVGLPGILRLLKGQARGAAFVTVVAYRDAGGSVRCFRGEERGRVLPAPRGTGGFGYDPIFAAEASTGSYAELSPEEKSRRSHRGRAVAALVRALDREG